MTPQPIETRIRSEVNNLLAEFWDFLPGENKMDFDPLLDRHLAAFVTFMGVKQPTPHKLVMLARAWSRRFYEIFIDPAPHQSGLTHEEQVWITNRLTYSLLELTGRNRGAVHDLACSWAKVLSNASLDALTGQGFSSIA